MSNHLDFSIIIPTRNRPRQLAACLESIAHIEYLRSHFEVIVVDDGSKTSMELVTSSCSDLLNLTLQTLAGAGPASARNAGAAIARGRFLAFTDDDCTPAPDWLQKLAARFESAHNRMIGGRTINALSDNVYSTASQILISYLYCYYNADLENARFLTSNNIAMPAEHFRRLGGFNPDYPGAAAEDRDLCDRWRLSGYDMIYAPEVIVYHRHQLRPSTFWQQHFGYGRGAFRFQRARYHRSGKSLRFEPLAFYLNLMLYPFLKGKSRWPLFITGLLILSQIGNAGGFFWEWLNQTKPGRRMRGRSRSTAKSS